MSSLKRQTITDINDAVHHENAEQLFEQSGSLFLSNTLIATIFLGVSWNDLPQTYLAAWYALLILVVTLRFVVAMRFRNRGFSGIATHTLEKTAVIGTLATGVLWASLAFLIPFTDQEVYHLLVTLILVGLAAGSIASNSYIPSAYFAFMIPILTTLSVVFLLQPEKHSITIGLLLLFFMGFLAVSARRYHFNIYQSTQLAIENQQLNRSLENSKKELEESVRKLQKLSTADPLTGVANRRRYEEFILDSWTQCWRSKSPISLIILDIDHFKAYNDSYGHQMGDQTLVRVAKAIQMSLRRSTDLVARIGGEEFAVIMPATNMAGALRIATEIKQRVLGMQIYHRDSSCHRYITVSMGTATEEDIKDGDFSLLVGAADSALYQAKNNGRNRIETASELIHRKDPLLPDAQDSNIIRLKE